MRRTPCSDGWHLGLAGQATNAEQCQSGAPRRVGKNTGDYCTTSSLNDSRNRAIMMVAFASGGRRSEFAGL